MCYKSKNTASWFALWLMAICCGCNNISSNNQPCNFTLDVNNPVIIQNKSTYQATFQIAWDGSFLNFDSILSAIENMPNDFLNEPLERKSWRFVIKKMDFLRNPLGSSDHHHPLVQLNSIGYGQCDDLTTLLYFIWIKQGFKARILGLGKHVVPEVYVNGKWQMYDPSFQAYYLNSSGIPASVQELTENNNLILNPLKKISIHEPDNILANTMDSLRYGVRASKHYLSEKYHFENKSYYKTVVVNDFKINIPTKSTITLPIYNPFILNQVDWLLQKTDNNYYLKLVLPPNSHGTIGIPLVLIAIEGDASFRSSAQTELIYTTSQNQKPLEIVDTALSIIKVDKATTLYYKLPKKFAQPTRIEILTKQDLTTFVSQ